MNLNRINYLNKIPSRSGNIIYWMSRDMRINDNWALLYAQKISIEYNKNLIVVFNLLQKFGLAEERQFDFMLNGLKELEQILQKHNIPLIITLGEPKDTIPQIVKQYNVKTLITDFSPLKISREWKEEVNKLIDIAFYEIDTHNIIPVWITSPKQEYGAYTIRPKIHRILDEWLVDIPKLNDFQQNNIYDYPKNDWDTIKNFIKVDNSVPRVDWISAGEKSANNILQNFINHKIKNYSKDRNFPEKDSLSNLSPFLHFGQISAQRIVIDIKSKIKDPEIYKSFFEELIIRKELSDNFCFYNPDYDNFDGFPNWAKITLNQHRQDIREYLYTKEELEFGLTHDNLWNSAQKEMLRTGKMHGYIRMYWAKKILEWTESPEQALEYTIYLNDKYELDGRDPIGYTNIAWSIGGVHDRAWFERPIFGKIRYMSLASTGKKFDSKLYIKSNSRLTSQQHHSKYQKS